MTRSFETIIGLEIHLQLKTNSKMFCACPNVLGEAEPNTAVCPVCMGHPGTLPVPNQEAIRQGVRLASALHGDLATVMRFDRKNYFYPDLPKGYQISQFDRPLSRGGYVELALPNGESHRISLERLHLEEDAGKNFHVREKTLVDYNRAGTPLAEIVTHADIRSPAEARAFLQELRLIARYIGASDADMEKGQLRCDANVSLRPVGDERLHPKTEIKNMNSFKSVERALLFEVDRQRALWESGAAPAGNETRGWDESRAETMPQRTKEGSDDYRYFPDPDIPPIALERAYVALVSEGIPELPNDKRLRFMGEYGLALGDADVLVQRKDIAAYFEEVVSELKEWFADETIGETAAEKRWESEGKRFIKYAHSWLTTELFKHLKTDDAQIQNIKITPEDMAELIVLIAESKLNSSAAQTVFGIMYREGRDPHEIAEEKHLLQSHAAEDLRPMVTRVIEEHQAQVAQYKKGKTNVIQFLVGAVMKASGGGANPAEIRALLEEFLKE